MTVEEQNTCSRNNEKKKTAVSIRWRTLVKEFMFSYACWDLWDWWNAAKEEKRLSYPEDEEVAVVILRWMLGFTKSKIFQLLENFASVVNEIFQPTPKEKPTSELNDLLDEKVRSSLLLSVVILLIVVFARGHDSWSLLANQKIYAASAQLLLHKLTLSVSGFSKCVNNVNFVEF